MNHFISLVLLFSIASSLSAEKELYPRRFPISRKKCVVDGKNYFSGQKIVTDDICKTCYCKFGRTSCRTTRCDEAPFCQDPVKTPGECCTKCECTSEGIMYGEGEAWSYREPQTDKCIQCQCMDGQAFCAPDPANSEQCGNNMFMKRNFAANEEERVSELFE